MSEKISQWLFAKSTGYVALTATILFLLFAVLVLPGQSAAANAFSAGAGTPDTSFLYSASDLYAMADAYGASGRAAYVRARFTFDLIFPLVFTFFLASTCSWFLARLLPNDCPWRIINLAPLLGMLFDYAENISAGLFMLRYPQPTALLAMLAPIFTFMKWVFVGGSFILLIGASIVFVGKAAKTKRGK